MDYAAIARALREANFDGTAVLEIQGDDPLEVIRSGRAYLEQYLPGELSES